LTLLHQLRETRANLDKALISEPFDARCAAA
jgi:hypothetical protein